jgi:hypothetical protein
MVQIANPIYDVVFKYLMKDEKVAKLLLSTIIGREIISLEFRPTEYHFPVGELLTVLRMDFSARILDNTGKEELIILELQKAKMASDIMRFRRYLGEQYSNKENVVREPKQEYPFRKALPILSIYFLGHTLANTRAPVLRVNRSYVDAATGELVPEREEFIESLTHDSIIIQIPYLSGKRITELEQLLALFDQSSQALDHHFLNISEEDLPERYRPLLRRLQQAIADPQVRQTMEAEDDLIEELKDYQRVISERERMIAERERMISEKEQTISEKEQVISDRDRMLLDKQEQLEKAILELYHLGTDPMKLATTFGMTIEEIQQIVKK